MPRQGRIDFPGALHHVIVRGINRAPVFLDDYDRKNFILRLKKALEETKLACLAWCLIPNHIHLLLRTGRIALSDLMRRLLTGYALFFNRRHNRVKSDQLPRHLMMISQTGRLDLIDQSMM